MSMNIFLEEKIIKKLKLFRKSVTLPLKVTLIVSLNKSIIYNAEIKMEENLSPILKLDKKKWYVLLTKPKFEKKVSEGLSKVNIMNYLPLHKQLRIWHDRKKWVEMPLFSSYIFVNIDENSRNKVFGINGIVKYISNAGEIAILKEEEIDRIKRLCSYLGEIEIEKSNVKIGEEVEIVSGHFKGMQGHVVSMRGKYKLSIAIPGLGSYANIEIDRKQIQKAI